MNFEPPWNPARLEPRIGRVHRLGQSRPVHVIHMLTPDSIEERVWETLRLKKSLFAGVFDSPTGEVSFAKLGRKTVFETVKEIFADQPGRPKPTIDREAPVPLKPMTVAAPPPTSPVGAAGVAPPQVNAALGRSDGNGVEMAAAALMEAGIKFLESIAADSAAGGTEAGSGSRLDQILSGLFARDSRTNRPVLSIPLPESMSQQRLAAAIAGLVTSLRRSV